LPYKRPGRYKFLCFYFGRSIFKLSNAIGIGGGKKKKFRIRDEAGKLLPDATLSTILPVNIEVELTEKYINQKQKKETTHEKTI